MNPSHLLITSEQLAAPLTEAAQDMGMESRVVTDEELRLEDLAWADSWVGMRPPIGPDASHIRWYHSGTDGVESYHPLFPAMRETGAILTHTIGTMPHRIGEYVVAQVLSHVRNLPDYAAAQQRHEWVTHRYDTAMNDRVVIYGTGNVGSAIARLLRPFVARIDGVSRSGRLRPNFDSTVSFERSADIARQADIVIAALPDTPDTHGLLGEEVFSALDGALFVNVGRGVTVDPQALHEALDSRHVGTAILDVHEVEPLPRDDWRWDHPHVRITGHGSGYTMPSDVAMDFREACRALRAGERPRNQVDLSRWY